MTAPAPSPAEAAVIDRFGIFDEERAIESVARALFAATPGRHVWDNATNLGQHQRDEARRLARAAITAYRAQDGGAEAAVRRALALADELEADAQRQVDHYPPDSDVLPAVVGRSWVNAARQFRAALAPQAVDGAR